MIDLAQRSEAYELELLYGLKVTVRPLTTAGMAAGRWLTTSLFDPYRPERHYMRRPGPTWQEKHAQRWAALVWAMES
jgi:hypothetical protein